MGFQRDDPFDSIRNELKGIAHDSINEIEIIESNMEMEQRCPRS